MPQLLKTNRCGGRAKKSGGRLEERRERVHRGGHCQASREDGAGDRGDVILGPRRSKAGRDTLVHDLSLLNRRTAASTASSLKPMPDFWPSCGYRLLAATAAGRLAVSDDFLRD